MELDNRSLLVIQVVFGLVAWSCVAWAVVRPAIAGVDDRRVLRWLVAPQMFRYVGMSLLANGVAGPQLPSEFATWVATGDAITSVLAIAAFVVVGRSLAAGKVLVGVATIVGTADLLHNLRLGMQLHAPDHLGGGWLIVALLVPGMLVAHGLAAARLLRKA